MKRKLLDKALVDAAHCGVLVWGFIIDPKDHSVSTFCNQPMPLDDILVNTATAANELAKNHKEIGVYHA